MKIRWMQRKRKLTADVVKAYSEKWSVSMSDAKKELEKDNTGYTLQYRTWYGKWKEIPAVTEYFE
jgi:hypothetical protein